MKGLAITGENLKNQQEVVKNEVRVNVLNQPYGGFPWLDLPQYANTELVQLPQLLRRPEGPRRRDARGRVQVLQDLLRAQQRGAGRRRRLRSGAGEGVDREVFRARCPASQLPPEARHLRAAAGEGETREQGRQARDASRARDRLPRPQAQHARVLRDGPDRRDHGPGQGLAALPGAGAEERADRRRQRRDQLGPRQHVQHQRSDAVGRLAHPRQGQVGGPDPQGLRRGDREDPHDAGRPGDAGSRARQEALLVLRQDGAVQRLRQGRHCSPRWRCSTTTPRRSTRSRPSSARSRPR